MKRSEMFETTTGEPAVLRTPSLAGILVLVIALAAMPSTASSEKANRIPPKAERALLNATKMTLFSIDPAISRRPLSSNEFHGRRVLRQIVVTDSNVRDAVVKTIGAATNGFSGIGLRCFDPQHGIRVQQGVKTYDFEISYRCKSMRVYSNETLVGVVAISGSPSVLDGFLRPAKAE